MYDKTALIPERLNSRRDQGQEPSFAWKRSALATAAALTLLGASIDAYAVALGAVQIKSALGEPLRAEIEVPEISSDEASTFQATLGTPQEFQAAGIDYSQSLSGTRITLEHRPNGQAYLRVEGQQPVNEPFLGIVIDANWSAGHVVRDYTVLLDPRRQSAGAPPQSAEQINEPAVAPVTPQRSTATSASSRSRATPGPAELSGPQSFDANLVAAGQVRVRRGDTATSLAEAHQANGVSLDQMMVAMLRANPQAFIHDHINLVRAGAVIDIPSAEQAAAISPSSARRTIIAQSRDFHAFRQGLAKAATHGSPIAAGNRRSAAGSVQTKVQDNSAPPASQDQLILPRGGTSAGSSETHVAQSRHEQAQHARQAELDHNISELSQLAAASGNAAANSPTQSPANGNLFPPPPTINVPPPASITPVNVASTLATATALQPISAASATVEASATAVAVTASAAASPVAPAAEPRPRPQPPRQALPPSAPTPDPSFLDTLLDNLLIIVGLVVVIAVLAGYFIFFRKKKKKVTKHTVDSSIAFAESKLQPDSFFGASGGQRVNTHEAEGNAEASSSMAYSPSQLEAAGDVDPVAEADVYLAYGRDAQAEEILKEAMHTYPQKSLIYLKLAEVYARRHDIPALENLASKARQIIPGDNPDWLGIASLGSKLDPGNPLYKSIATAKTVASPLTQQSPQNIFSADTQLLETPADPPPDLDIDLDHDSSSPILPESPAASPSAPIPVPRPAPAPLARGSGKNSTARAPLNVDFTPPPPEPEASGQQTHAVPNSGLIEFSMEPANSHFGSPGTQQSKEDPDPLTTKLALAQEFHAIGDNTSARSLIKEVIADASGSLKTKAEQFLSDLG